MSTRTFWAIFTISIIILIEILVVQSGLQWMLTEELSTRNFKHMQVYGPDENSTAKVDNSYITRADVDGKSFWELLPMLYRADSRKAITITALMLLAGALVGFVLASIGFRHLVKIGDKMNKLSVADKVSILIGTIMGILLSSIFLPVILGDRRSPTATAVVGLLVTGLCVWVMMNMKEELKFYWPGLVKSPDYEKTFQKPKILDTNVIIDGRVSDVCGTGFIEGQVFVPSFVLDELQHIADSGDSLRRARGRRGLDILNQMRKDLGLEVRQTPPVSAENPEEVDARLVKLAKEIDGAIVTNDFNLNKVAELQGVTVLNINQLANALKPVVLPGEELAVNIIKEGKEMNQGIAYLDDGTMIVVEGAKKHIGETVDVIVASVLQTVAGKMIFANLKSAQEEEDALIDRNVRNYSGFRPRRKAY